jgi:hypothetical protein
VSNDATPRDRAQALPKCEICADAIISGRVRCSCGTDAEPHLGTCAIRRFEGTHRADGMTNPELLAAFGLKRIEDR